VAVQAPAEAAEPFAEEGVGPGGAVGGLGAVAAQVGVALSLLRLAAAGAVRAVLDGAGGTEVAALLGGHRWVVRYLTGQPAGLADRSHRPHSSPRRVAGTVEAAVAEMRREHPRWGSRRIGLEMLRKPGPWAGNQAEVPSERTIDRILRRQGLLRARPRKRS